MNSLVCFVLILQTEAKDAEDNLADKKKKLQDVQDLLNNLNRDFEEANNRKIDLENQVQQCSNRLDRAEKLITGLGGENKRWYVSARGQSGEW